MVYNRGMSEETKKNNITERVRAMLGQALAEARAQSAGQITAIHLIMYDHSIEALQAVRSALNELCPGTLAEGATLVPIAATSNFICWNCCGLRYQADDPEAACPNCGSVGLVIPPEIVFSLDHIEVAGSQFRQP